MPKAKNKETQHRRLSVGEKCIAADNSVTRTTPVL